jgi:hypothetical protein
MLSAPNDSGDLRDYLDAVFGDTTGVLHIGVGFGGHYENGNYVFDEFVSPHYTWPDEADIAIREILTEAEDSDVFCCPYLMRDGHRAKDHVVSHELIHADVDHDLDPAAVAELGGFAVSSGSSGHAHVYVPLSFAVTAAQHRMLCRGLRDRLGGDDKITASDLLRPPATLNHKSAANGGEPAAVTWLVPPGTRVNPQTLAALLNIDLAETAGNSRVDAHTKPVDLCDYPSVREVIDHVTGDRSADTFAIVAACHRAGLSLAQTRWAVSQCPKLVERLGERNDDDVLRIWLMLVDERQHRTRNPYPDDSRAPGGDDHFDGGPIPLTPNTVDVPPFPVDALPDVIANMVTELAEATQTDPAMPGTSALTVLAACIGGHAKIQARRGWREPLCLYTNTIARPAERKSAVQESMAAPLHDAEAEMSVAGAVEHLKLQDELDMAKKTVDQLNKCAVNAAAKAASPDATDQDKKIAAAAAEAARDAKAAMREIQVPVIPRLLADDVTPEAAASLLANHGGRIAIVSAEGGIFDTIAGRYTKTVNMDVYLKGHSGDRIRVDRQGRPPQYIPSPALTMGLMVQPRIIEAIAANRDFVGRGLLARFLYATPVSKVGFRVSDATPVCENTEAQYSHWIKKLASDMAGWAGDPAVLMLDERAEGRVRKIQDDVEPALVGDGDLASPASLSEWGGKYVGAVVRIAGLLHLAEHGANGVRYPVQAETVEKAERIGRYFKAAAINVFSQMGAGADIADAVYLLERVARLAADEVSERDVFTACSRSRFPTKEAMTPALKRLIDHGYLLPLGTPQPTGGRPASRRYKVRNLPQKPRKSQKGRRDRGSAAFAASAEAAGKDGANR